MVDALDIEKSKFIKNPFNIAELFREPETEKTTVYSTERKNSLLYI